MHHLSDSTQVSRAPHAFNRLFPLTFFSSSGDVVWVQFAYPYQQLIFSSLTAALVAILIPIGVILLTQIWVRSFCDAASAILGLAYSIITGTFFSVVLKKTVGGLRPHFLSVCEPVLPLQQIGAGYKNIMFTIQQVCTGKDKEKIGNAIESFPSGHAEIAFAGFFYLSIYLFAHLRIQSEHRVGYWRMVACLLPILLATYLASTLVLNYHHHSYDVVFGSLLGMVVALFGYRMVFKGIWDKGQNSSPSCHSGCQCKGDYPA
jgi:diacylglycerol diphosphate phosphatase/phosphatidate phosphatase